MDLIPKKILSDLFHKMTQDASIWHTLNLFHKTQVYMIYATFFVFNVITNASLIYTRVLFSHPFNDVILTSCRSKCQDFIIFISLKIYLFALLMQAFYIVIHIFEIKLYSYLD